MSFRPVMFFAATIAAAAFSAWQPAPASAGSYSGGGGSYGGGIGGTNYGHGPTCPTGVTINKNISIYKPVTITKSINIYKPTTITKNVSIDKSVNIYKPITITKNISITKNIDNSKNINIKKTIIINKGGGSASAQAFAEASASAQASAQASAKVTIYNGSYQYVNVHNNMGQDQMQLQAQAQCQMQEAVVVKAIHAACVAGDREFEASHMDSETWVNSSYEGEILRCIPGAHLKIVIGDVVQSDQGMAGAYQGGQVMECADGEALRHYKDGVLKCARAVPVKDCTERTNLRRWGSGDLFFSFRAQVCATPRESAAARAIELTGMSLSGGVGDGDAGY